MVPNFTSGSNLTRNMWAGSLRNMTASSNAPDLGVERAEHSHSRPENSILKLNDTRKLLKYATHQGII